MRCALSQTICLPPPHTHLFSFVLFFLISLCILLCSWWTPRSSSRTSHTTSFPLATAPFVSFWFRFGPFWCWRIVAEGISRTGFFPLFPRFLSIALASVDRRQPPRPEETSHFASVTPQLLLGCRWSALPKIKPSVSRTGLNHSDNNVYFSMEV